MTGASIRSLLLVIGGMAAFVISGCADLELPRWVPFQGPSSDKLSGVKTPAERIAELKALSQKAATTPPEERERISHELAASIRTEKDPLIRKEIIRTLGSYPGADADAILKAQMSDSDVNVRLATCEAWGKRQDAEAVAVLSEALRSDVSSDVRLAAAKALGETKSKEAVAPLGEALADSDPAMQYRAVLSLEQLTGKDLGHDVNRWQLYVNGELPDATPTLAERLKSMF